MIVFNVTIKVTWEINADFVSWMQQIHIPEVLATGMFYKSKMMRLLDTEEEEGPTYAIQYRARCRADYERYLVEFAPELREKTYEKWGEAYIAYRSVLEIVE